MFEGLAQCVVTRQLMDKAEEQPELPRMKTLPLFYPLFIKPKSHSLQLLSIPVSSHRVNKKCLAAVNESL